MSTGENQSSLYSVLYEAMNDPGMIGDLLRHPEFRRKAGQICYRLAGPAGGEDLLQEACLRVEERISQLDPNSLRNEGEFFGWFSQLARRVHLSRVLSAAAVSSCTEKAEGWPDSLFDVPPDEMGRFLAHADGCPYHTGLLEAEDKKLRAIFRWEHGAGLRASIAEYERRLQKWQEAAFKKGKLFGHIALVNGTREVASCGKFYDFSIHISRNELDTYSGLEIRGIAGSNPDEEVPLGFYALDGVRHVGEEKTLKLINGYTVGLKVKHVEGTTFDIHFRCVESKTLDTKGATDESAADVTLIEMTDDKRYDNSPGSFTPSAPLPVDVRVPESGWWPRSPGWRASATFALLMLVAVPCLMIGKKLGRDAATGDMLLTQVMESRAMALSPVQTSTGINDDANPRTVTRTRRYNSGDEFERTKDLKRRQGFDAFTKVRRSAAYNHDPASGLAGRWLLGDPAVSASRSRPGAEPSVVIPPKAPTQEDDKAKVQHIADTINDGKVDFHAAPGQTVSPRPNVTAGVDDQRSTPPLLRSSYVRRDAAKNSMRGRTNASLKNASYEDAEDAPDKSVLHSATNDTLLRKLDVALGRLGLHVEHVTERNPEPARFRVNWAVSTTESSWDKGSFAVKLDVYIYKEGETKAVYYSSYIGEGRSLDAAYGKAIDNAVEPVIFWIGRDRGKSQSTLSGELGGAKQHGAGALEVNLTVKHKNGDVRHTDHSEQGTPKQEIWCSRWGKKHRGNV
jgi:hypothetical protein